MADPLNPLTEEEIALAEATEECLNTLFGEGAFEAFLQNMLSADGPLKACIAACVVDVLTDPEQSPITKDYLAEVIQGEDLDEGGTVGTVVENPTEEEINTGQVTFTSSAVAVATLVKGGFNREAVKG